MALGIISLFFLVAFTFLYLDKGLEKKPDFVAKAAHKVTDNIEVLSFWGAIYSLVAIILIPLLADDNLTLLVGLLANVLLFFLTLPHTLDHMLARYPDKIPAPLVAELRNIVGAVAKREKVAGYAGAALSFLLFLVLFR